MRIFTRSLAAVLGAAQAGLIAVVNPMAGWFLAIQTTEIKFTSMAYLEALPALAIVVSVLAYERFRRTARTLWLCLSAVGLGMAVASKFIYVAGGLTVALFLLWEERKRPRHILTYGVVAVAVFAIASPYFWSDPLGRLQEMVGFHMSSSQRDYVTQLNRPWWYLWPVLATPALIYAPIYEYPPFYVMACDGLIFALGLLGLPSLTRRSPLYRAWFVAGMIFLALWSAKWERSAMIVATPLCMSAGCLVSDVLQWARTTWRVKRRASDRLAA